MSINFIERWQQLIGAFLGPFLAIILSGIGFWIRSKYLSSKERREAMRRTEVSLSLTLNDISSEKEEFKKFIGRIKNIINEIQLSPRDTYSIHETNFPHVKDIFIDEEIPNLKFKSYYLHNKLLLIYSETRSINVSFRELKENFNAILRKNELLVVGVRDNPENQKAIFKDNLNNFVVGLGKFVENLDSGIITMNQAKIYNLKLMQRNLITRWKYEGLSMKYFKKKSDCMQYASSLDSLERIDQILKKEVDEAIRQAEARS